MNSIEAVVFDLDDTLYLELDYVRSGFRAVGELVRQRFGREGFAAAAWQLFQTGVRRDIFDRVLRQLDVAADSATVAEMVRVYREHAPDIVLLPDAERCLDALQGIVGLALISDGPLASQTAKARQLGLDRWMAPIILTATWGAGFDKPHPRAFQEVQTALNVRGERCVYVGDNPAKDFDAPAILGWRSVRIRRPDGLHATVPSRVPTHLEIETLDALPGSLATLATTDCSIK